MSSLKMIMDSSKNSGWIILFKKFRVYEDKENFVISRLLIISVMHLFIYQWMMRYNHV